MTITFDTGLLSLAMSQPRGQNRVEYTYKLK